MTILKRSIAKLRESAQLRFSEDEAKRATYIQEHLNASEKHDQDHYWITPHAWRELKARIITEHGERPRLGSPVPSKPSQRRLVSDPSQPRKPTPKGPGSHLKDIIAERFGSLPGQGCGCSSMVAKMDKWGVEGCRENREEIIAHLMGQTDQLPKGKRWALNFPGGKYVARKIAESMVDEAVGRVEFGHSPVEAHSVSSAPQSEGRGGPGSGHRKVTVCDSKRPLPLAGR